MLADGFFYALWVSALGFPLWIGFVMLAAQLMNVTSFEGIRAVPETIAIMLAGMAVGVGLSWPLIWQPDVSLSVAFCYMAVFIGYALVFGQSLNNRAIQLNEKRQQLRAQLQEIRQLQHQLQALAIQDPLTGLFNRRHLGEVFPELLARSAQAHRPLVVAMIDIDHFKQVNDTWGHAIGDSVLVSLAKLLRQVKSEAENAYRLGGEEFLWVLEDAPLDEAEQRINAL